MKKLFATLMTVLFLGSTGLVLADEATPSATPAMKTSHKTHKKAKKVKKSKPAATAASTTPTSK